MWLTWLVLVLVSASLMIVQAVLVLRDKVVGVPPMRQDAAIWACWLTPSSICAMSSSSIQTTARSRDSSA
jgi:hypothetical protein